MQQALSKKIDKYMDWMYYTYMFLSALQKSGLNPKQAKVYDALIEKGEAPAAEIATISGLKRGIVYKILKDFEDSGLVSTFSKNKKTYFRMEHPYKLSEYIEKQLLERQNELLTLRSVLPQIISTYNTVENQPGVRVFEGIEGIKEIYLDTLKEKKEIWAILQTSEVEPKLYRWLTTHYVKKRAAADIWAKVIVAEGENTSDYIEHNQEQKRTTKTVPQERFPIAIEMDIYGDKIAFMNFKKDTPHIGILIENPLIAQTMRSLFTLAWEGITNGTIST